jgi:hypothetical protein
LRCRRGSLGVVFALGECVENLRGVLVALGLEPQSTENAFGIGVDASGSLFESLGGLDAGRPLVDLGSDAGLVVLGLRLELGFHGGSVLAELLAHPFLGALHGGEPLGRVRVGLLVVGLLLFVLLLVLIGVEVGIVVLAGAGLDLVGVVTFVEIGVIVGDVPGGGLRLALALGGLFAAGHRQEGRSRVGE